MIMRGRKDCFFPGWVCHAGVDINACLPSFGAYSSYVVDEC